MGFAIAPPIEPMLAKLADSILQSRLDAQNQHDITSTPSFVIDGQKVTDVREVEDLAEVIDPLLEGS